VGYVANVYALCGCYPICLICRNSYSYTGDVWSFLKIGFLFQARWSIIMMMPWYFCVEKKNAFIVPIGCCCWFHNLQSRNFKSAVDTNKLKEICCLYAKVPLFGFKHCYHLCYVPSICNRLVRIDITFCLWMSGLEYDAYMKGSWILVLETHNWW
jgi:hypothetical protein